MQKLEIHPPSLLAGTVLAILAFVAMAPTPPPPTQSATSAVGGLVPARNMVQIKEGVPYIVPVGTLLVITGVGVSEFPTVGGSGNSFLRINGAKECGTYGITRSVESVPVGLSIPAGSIVEVDDNTGPSLTGRAWGYLERP